MNEQHDFWQDVYEYTKRDIDATLSMYNLQETPIGLITDEEMVRNMTAEATVEILMRRAEALLMEASRIQEKLERFGDGSQFKNHTVLKWDQVYNNNDRTYTFTALKVAGYWYTSGLFQRTRLSYEQLVEQHLSKAVEGSVVKMNKGKVLY